MTLIGSRDPAAPDTSQATTPSLLVNTLWSMSAEGIRLVSSLVTFLILTRLYEPRQFGILVATMNLFGFLFPQASMGAGWLVLRRIASEGWDPAAALARATGTTIAGGLAIGGFLVLIRPILLPQASLPLFIGLGLTEFFLVGMVEITLFAAQATEKLVVKAVVWSAYGVGRALAATTMLLLMESPDLGPWIVANVIVVSLVLVVAQFMTVGRFVMPERPRWDDVRQGVPYSLGFGADRLRDVTDTLVLVRTGSVEATGLYAAGRRLINVAQSPIIAGLHSTNASIWRAGSESVAAAKSVAVRFTTIGAVYGAAAGAGLYVLGGLATSLLGESYGETELVLRLMCPIPMLLALETFPAMAMTASGYNTHRVVLTALTGLSNLVLNLLWVPAHGWRGAVWASLVSSVVYIAVLWATLTWAAHRPPRSTGREQAETEVAR